jgi:hypothetical protein
MRWIGMVGVMAALAAGIVVGAATAPDWGEMFRPERLEMTRCRAVLRNDAENMAMLRLSGITEHVNEPDATALVCGCATNSVAPTSTLRWGFMKSLRSQRLPYCIGHWQARIER